MALAKPECEPPVSGDEAYFVEAIKGQKVKDNGVTEVKAVLKMIFVKVGLRALNWPAEQEKDVLVNHIYSNYGNHTLSEILLAFEMAITGKLNLEHKEVVAYENFSCLYFSTIMNSYREWAKEAYKMTVKEQPKMIENKESLSDQAMSDWCEEIRKRMNAPTFSVEFVPEMLYDWLMKTGKHQVGIVEKKLYMEAAVDFRQKQLAELTVKGDEESKKYHRDFVAMKEKGCFEGPEVDRLKTLAKKMVVFDYLKERE